jgi:UDP-N-acetyl-D-mannosaminuronic acid dehydrogenase
LKSPTPSVCIVGLGFVGLTLAARLSEKLTVFGLEASHEVRQTILQGRAHFFEPGLDELVSKAVRGGRLVPISSAEELPKEVKDFVITVGTPLRNNDIDLRPVLRAISEIGSRVHSESLIVVRSTVAVGVSRDVVLNFFQSSGASPMVAMCPERTIEGKALEELSLLPQIISGDRKESEVRAAELFSNLGCPIEVVSSLETAEAVKLVANTFRDVQFAFANEVALIASAMGLHADEIISASNKGYPRSAISRPGLTGGPCLEKDPWIFAKSAQKRGVVPEVTMAARRTHEAVVSATLPRLQSLYQNADCSEQGVLVAGLAFKGFPETSDVRGSLAKSLRVALSQMVSEESIFWADPLVSQKDAEKLGFLVHLPLNQAMVRSRLVVIQNDNHELMRSLQSFLETNPSWNGAIFDYAGKLNPRQTGIFSYVKFGS